MPQRQKVTRQLRKEQVKKYLEFVKLEREKHGSLKRERKDNRKKTKVAFGETLLLQDAVENFDDREGEIFTPILHTWAEQTIGNVYKIMRIVQVK